MKNLSVIKKTFRKSPKSVKLKKCVNYSQFIISKKNYKLFDNQIFALSQKLIRKFKQHKAYFQANPSNFEFSRPLGSKLGSGKGKFKRKFKKVNKYQSLFFFPHHDKLGPLSQNLRQFSKGIALRKNILNE